MSMFEYLKNEMDGREFKTQEEYANAVKAIIEDTEYELGRVERWALGLRGEEIEEQLGCTVKEDE